MSADGEPGQADWTKGVICTDSGDLIARPRLTFEQMRATPPGGAARVEAGAARCRATSDPVMVSGYECVAQWDFVEGVLGELAVVVTEATAARFGFETGFASPPDGPEVRFLEEWVCRETGRTPPVCFGWGEIGGVYDAIGGFARIRFVYGAGRRQGR